METNQLNTKSSAKTIDILLSFDHSNTHQKASDIARNLRLNISTVSRHLSDLVSYGLLEQDAESAYYHLGTSALSLAGIALSSNNLYKTAYIDILELSKTMNMHASVSVLRGNSIVYLFEICTPNSLHLLMPVGYARPAAASAMGRVLLADLSPHSAYSIVANTKLNQATPYSVTIVKDIMQKIDFARENLYSVLIDEIKFGTSSIAVAIFDKNHKAIGAVSLSTKTENLTPEKQKEMISNLLTTTNKISAKLGYFVR